MTDSNTHYDTVPFGDLVPELDSIHRNSMERKRISYWIGFLEGVVSSNQIERGEPEAILAEACGFRTFFDDPDAGDLAEDLRAECFSSDQDLLDQLHTIASDKRSELVQGGDMNTADAMNEFLGFCAGVICDGSVLHAEVEAISQRFDTCPALASAPAFKDLRSVIRRVLEDQIVTTEEAEEVREWLARLVGDGYSYTGLPNIGITSELDVPIRDSSLITIEGSCFVLTGPMGLGTRSYIIEQIELCGGTVSAFPSNKTHYVIVSMQASRHWKTTHFGTKIEKTKLLISNGSNVRFVCESALGKALSAQGGD